MKTVAKRPYDELQDVDERFSFLCSTCWQSVEQPVIRGLWYHADDFQQGSYKCNKLVPVKRDKLPRHEDYKCQHQFRFDENLGGALRCIKCKFPQRIDLLGHKDNRCNYFCLECKKQFKILSQHYAKVHKNKGFEFDILPIEMRSEK